MYKFNFFIKTSQHLNANGKFPNTEMIIPFLWHEGENVDSDGEEEGEEKIYRYLQNRDKPEEKFVVGRIQKLQGSYVYQVESDLEPIAARTAYFLATVMNGEVGTGAGGPFSPPVFLLDKIGKEFKLADAFKRVENSPYWK